MNFRTPAFLWLLVAIPPLLVFLIARERTRMRIARRFTSERLRGTAAAGRALRPWLIALAFAAAVVAAAGPYFGYTMMPVEARDANRVLVIDVSNSMAAEDVGAPRLSAAKALAKRIVDAHSGRVALVVFEQSAEVVAPLTNDGEAVLALLETIQTGEVAAPGSDIGGAVIAAMKLVEADQSHKADIILISDGEEQGSRIAEAVARTKARNVPVATIMIGNPSGSSIPAGDGVLRNDQGEIVTTYARADVLENLARETGGRFFENPFSDRALDPLLAARPGAATRETLVRVPVDRYQWPLALAFALLLGGSLLNRGAE